MDLQKIDVKLTCKKTDKGYSLSCDVNGGGRNIVDVPTIQYHGMSEAMALDMVNRFHSSLLGLKVKFDRQDSPNETAIKYNDITLPQFLGAELTCLGVFIQLSATSVAKLK